MSAADELRQLLTKRGIEYESVGGITTWVHSGCYVAEYDELLDGSDTRLIVFRATPEQAIAATTDTGRYGTCHFVAYNDNYAYCDRCGLSVPRTHGGWWFYCPGCGKKVIS